MSENIAKSFFLGGGEYFFDLDCMDYSFLLVFLFYCTGLWYKLQKYVYIISRHDNELVRSWSEILHNKKHVTQ